MRRFLLVCVCLATCLSFLSSPSLAGIYQWAWKDNSDHSKGKVQSTTLCPGGVGVSAAPYANLVGRDLTQAYLINSDLRYANLNAALLADSDFSNASLSGVHLSGVTLSNVNFSNADLTDATIDPIGFDNVVFSGATIKGAYLGNATHKGFTASQFYSTASYQSGDLSGITLDGNGMSGWSFSGKNLSNVRFWGATLTGADFTDATVTGTRFRSCFSPEQLYTTANYKAGDLSGIAMGSCNMAGCNLAGKNLADVYFNSAILSNADLTNANLTGTDLSNAILSNASFAGAVVRNADFYAVTHSGFTAQQLYSTASYQSGDLSGIRLDGNDMRGWCFSGKDLTGAFFGKAVLNDNDFRNANLTNAALGYIYGADLRGSRGSTGGLSATNMIAPDGTIAGLHLDATNPLLIVRDYDGASPIPIHVQQSANIEAGSVLQVLFEDATWGSTVAFDPGIAVTLAGDLELDFAAGVDPAGLLGTSYRLFDWTGVAPTGQFHLVSDLPAGLGWDASQLYSLGAVTLVPEPATVTQLLAALLALCAGATWRRLQRKTFCTRLPDGIVEAASRRFRSDWETTPSSQ